MTILNRPDVMRSSKGKFQLKMLGGLALAMMISLGAASSAAAETRSLKLYFIHTKERAEITYKRNGRYDKKGIEQINRFLRDWRRNEPANMDPKLLDLMWEVYRSVGARDYIHVVSAYRSPKTNSSLRSRSSGVAENSQHMKGKAIDFYIPGVKLSTLRAAGFKAETGGVGYYPKSGAPFIHLDTGNVRSWPRMSRKELMALFPDGRTIHLPSDGKPLPGYQQAMAAYKARQKSGTTQLASLDSGSSRASSGSGGGLLTALFGGNRNDERPAAAPARPTPAPAAPVRQTAPAPVATPAPQAETIIAALPERNPPVPGAAPRPLLDVGAKPAQPIIPGIAVGATPEEPLQADAAPVLAQVPLPTRRPEYAPAAEVAVAAEDLPITAIAADRTPTGGSEAIAEMLALSAADARAGVVINNVPIPTMRPSLDGDDSALARQVAAVSSGGDVFALAALPETRPAALGINQAAVEIPPAPQQDERIAALSEKPRIAPIGRELDSGVRTSGKAARPQAGSSRTEPKARTVPIDRDVTSWAFRRDLDVNNAGGTTNGKAYNVVWSAPETVYTHGFQPSASDADPNRFTGKAVNFISVARFPAKQN